LSDLEALPALPGTYVLLMRVRHSACLTVGSLGECNLDSGWYVYVGSAQGSGGLRARIGRHLRKAERRHWHIDYLREVAPVEEVWLCAGPPLECTWAQVFRKAGLAIPIAGFGSSDCRCASHLFYSRERPRIAILGDMAGNIKVFGVVA
jgi:Uri superfamily endonuclease